MTLLPNGDFETGNLTGWNTNNGAPYTLVTNTFAHSGMYSCRLWGWAGGQGIWSTTNVIGPTTESFGFWFRVEDQTLPGYEYYLVVAVGTGRSREQLDRIKVTNYSSGWHHYSYSGTMPVSPLCVWMAYVNVPRGYPQNLSGYMYVDDFYYNPVEVNASFTANPTALQVPGYVQFTDTSTGDFISSWLWDFGDGNTSVQQNPSHQYIATGNYTVSLTVYSDRGTSDTYTVSNCIVVTSSPTAGAPVPDFSASPDHGNCPLTVNFTDASTNSPIGWWWTFGDGSDASTDQNPTHIYATRGIFTVTLQAYNNIGSGTTTKANFIDTSCAVHFSATPLTGTEPLSVTFTDESTGTPSAWDWDYGDGSAHGTAQNPTHIYSHDGIYTVTLEATFNSGACGTGGVFSLVKTGYIIVSAVITPPTPPTPPLPPSPNPPGRASNTQDGAITYQLNSSTSSEDSGSQYEHLMALRETTNYDLRTRPATYLYPYTAFDADTMVITNSGGAWTVNEFANMWVFFVGQNAKGVMTYGVISSNDATTITCSGMCGEENATATGYILIYQGWAIDFVPDVSQPSVVKNFDVNSTVFEYSDNDDKRKLSTKVVATGKDLFGKTISVMVAAVHAYDNAKQMFADATMVTRRSEGYVYKNNYVPAASQRAVTATKANGGEAFTTLYSSFPTYIMVAANWADFVLNAEVTFSTVTGTLPSGITAGTTYYIVNRGGASWFEISTTPLGAAIDIGSDAVGTVYAVTLGGLIIDNTDSFIVNGTQVVLFGASAPGGISLGSTITNASPTYSSSAYWINCGTGVGPGVGTSLAVYHLSALGNSDIGTLPAVWIYGWTYTIPSGSNMAFCIPNSGSAGTAASTIGATTEGTDSSSVQYTRVALSAFPATDFSGKGYLLNKRLWVQNASYVGNNEVLIGEETITIDSNGNDTTYGNYIQFASVVNRVTSSTLKAYPHDVGALVARTNYTEASPESTSAIALDGIHIGNFTVDGNVTYGQLDTYVTYMLLGLGNFYRKATCWSPMVYGYVNEVGVFHGSAETSRARPIAVGDRISITTFTGETPIEYEVIEVTINHDEQRILLQLGDYEKNVFTSLEQSTNAVNRTLS